MLRTPVRAPTKTAEKEPVAAVAPGALSALLQQLAATRTVTRGEALFYPGQVVGRFELVREIGRGGFGIVYEAKDRELGRTVAFKALMIGPRPELREERLLREADAAARLSHPNIVTLFDVGRCEEGPYLVLEYLRGQTLAARLEQGPLPVREAVHIAMEVAKGLAHTHKQGVFHRDLTPGNVFLCEDGQIKVLDFGMAHAFGRRKIEGGTGPYMAPEQWRGAPEDERTDVFALGVVLFRMVTGEVPFTDRKSIESGGAAPRLEAPDVPALGALVARMLEKNPVKRPRDGAELLAPLAELRRQLEGAAPTQRGVTARRPDRRRARGSPRARRCTSIAVLPFLNMSADPEQEYFADGISEEILNALAHIEGLHVAGRTSSFSFKGKPDDIRTIAQRLNVGAVLEGSVRKAGNRVRVTAQLVDAAKGYHFWSDSYDRELSDVFAVQDEISRAVAQALKVKLLPGHEPTTRQHWTANPDVYNHYLLARQHYYRNSQDGYHDAVAEYEKALALDPGYAPAWAGLAVSLNFVADDEPTLERADVPRRRSIEAAEKAVALAPDLADGWASRGFVRALVHYDWSGARADLEKAIALNPGDPHARRRLGIVLSSVGRIDEAIAVLTKAVELDPLSPQTWGVLGYRYAAQGQLDLARNALNRALERSPESTDGLAGLALVEFLSGRPGAALEPLARCNVERDCLAAIAVVEHALGHSHESQRALDGLVARHSHVRAYSIAALYSVRGDPDGAFHWLERAIAQRDTAAYWLKIDPLLRPLHGDPRFGTLLRRMNLPPD